MAEAGELTPRQIVAELDKFVVGQAAAKRAVAVALRNRYRRQRLKGPLAEDIHPKNILMMGPTGVGKTEIARRLAKLCGAPFVKVEATKFTEVGYVGRDVDSMVRDLVETAIRMVRAEQMEGVRERAEQRATERLLDILAPPPRRREAPRNPLEALFSGPGRRAEEEPVSPDYEAERARIRQRLDLGLLEEQLVDVEVEDSTPPLVEIFSGQGAEEMGVNLGELLSGVLPRRKRTRRLTVAEARRVLAQEEAQKLIDADRVTAEAIRRAEQNGIIFLDEIDKIAGRGGGVGPDVSREGVQRDVLPIVEGSTVNTRYGPVKTDHVLFIAAGAFHVSKPSDLIPELQGRFPIRVELHSLGRDDFRRILTEPENALVKQYAALLETDGVRVRFEEGAIEEIADIAVRVNAATEDIGARRLHTILEKVLEEVSFAAPDLHQRELVIDREYVRARLADVLASEDLSRYIL